jgi:uncharacterized protein (TIGR02246 family)
VTVSAEAARKLLDDMFAAFNRHDAAAVVALMTPDVTFDTAGGPEVHGARHTGRAAVQAAFEAVWAGIPDVRWDAVTHHVGADHVTTTWIFRGTRGDGARIEVQGIDLFTFREGLVATKSAFRKDRPAIKA